MSVQMYLSRDPAFASKRMPPVTIGIDPVQLAKLRELVGHGGKFHNVRPDGSRTWSQTYGDLIRWAVKEFLARHAPEKKNAGNRTPRAEGQRGGAHKGGPRKTKKKSTKKVAKKPAKKKGGRR